jgi:hypothetical protein
VTRLGPDVLGGAVCLLEVHYGPGAGQIYLLCGICPGQRRVDDKPGGSIMELAAHILKHRDEERAASG